MTGQEELGIESSKRLWILNKIPMHSYNEETKYD